ncbi:hypothetical protein [Allorhodopirellula heiligendammensis]|uniref:Uncharacterized protein n=1 Tax=Allorhodopirellula heiligendammensis TaxID=2714739 RepID=A0A5C6C836_9BACT|nr:hypothetical protein [Allorhodopirellula heiligendammensis]TWU19671.1 hypothetical protein Poly21_18460 [Allorhodopirellula heiligendammensis]
MKRNINQAVATARTAARRSKNVVVALAASASLFSCGTAAHAFGGHGYAGGERIVSSRVVSDTVVGDTGGGESTLTSDSSSSGDCANGNCGGGGLHGGLVDGGMVQGREYGQPDLFYNFYTQGAANSANAQMYVSPVPVPQHVGHTYLTYQPFYPHEMLYKHHDRFHNYYDGGRGMNRTHVSYYYPPVRTGLSNFYWNVLRIPR